MKNRSICYTLLLSCSFASFMPSEAMQSLRQKVQTLKQQFAQKMPNWAKGAGFRAAKKKHWGKQPLTAQEQKDYKALMTAVGIGAIIAALAIAAGIATHYAKKASAAKVASPKAAAMQANKISKIGENLKKLDDSDLNILGPEVLDIALGYQPLEEEPIHGASTKEELLILYENIIAEKTKRFTKDDAEKLVQEYTLGDHNSRLRAHSKMINIPLVNKIIDMPNGKNRQTEIQKLYNQFTEYDKVLLPYAIDKYYRDILYEAIDPIYREEKRKKEEAETEAMDKIEKLLSNSENIKYLYWLLGNYNDDTSNDKLKNEILNKYKSLSQKEKQLFKEAVTLSNKTKYGFKKVDIQKLFGS